VAEVAFRDGWLSEDDYLDWRIKKSMDDEASVDAHEEQML
jgi:hypothetical protein